MSWYRLMLFDTFPLQLLSDRSHVSGSVISDNTMMFTLFTRWLVNVLYKTGVAGLFLKLLAKIYLMVIVGRLLTLVRVQVHDISILNVFQ